MKKILVIILTSLLLISGCTKKSGSESLFKAGVYEGSAKGYVEDIKISVTVDENKINEIMIISSNETTNLGGAALPLLVEDALKNQTIAVDVVAGATVTSDAFKEAMKNALTNATSNMEQLLKEKVAEEKSKVDLSYDVVVVGSGIAGLAAANVAKQQGKTVLLLEKMSLPGGASSTAGGGTLVTGAKIQTDQAIEDSKDLLFEDLMANGRNANDAETLQMYVDSIPNAVNWAADPNGGGLLYSDKLSTAPVYRANRISSPEGMGNGAVTSLLKTFESETTKLMLDTKATELIVEDGKVVGLMAENKTEIITIKANAVIFATGGYGANSALIPNHIAALPYAGAPGATGDALEMAKVVNAQTINMEQVNIQPNSIRLENGRGQHTFQACMKVYGTTGGILVSDQGVRFINESSDAYLVNQAMLKNKHTYLLMDEETYNIYIETAVASKNFTKEQADAWLASNGASDPVMVKGETLEALANTLNIDAESLQVTVDQYNESVNAGSDELFNRKVSKPMDTAGNYYAVEMHLRYYATLGGFKVNDQMQVLNTDNQAIEGLYAAGEVIGGALGEIYAPGALFGFSLTTGYNAGMAVSIK